MYGLREALAIFCEEGITNTIARHVKCAERLHAGLASIGLQMFVERPIDRLPTVNTIKVPANVDWKIVAEYAMTK